MNIENVDDVLRSPDFERLWLILKSNGLFEVYIVVRQYIETTLRANDLCIKIVYSLIF